MTSFNENSSTTPPLPPPSVFDFDISIFIFLCPVLQLLTCAHALFFLRRNALLQAWDKGQAGFIHFVISNAMLALCTLRIEMDGVFQILYKVIVDGSGIEETRACCLSLLQKREVLKVQ